MYELILIFAVSFVVTYAVMPWIIPKLVRAKLMGRDMNKPDRPKIPEMGGFGVIVGFYVGTLTAIGIHTFGYQIFGISMFEGLGLDLHLVLAAMATVLLMSIIGIFDDLFAINQTIKAVMPLLAALPLVAVKAGMSQMDVPFIGPVDFGIFYALVIIPIAITGASNVTNMLAGFNGLEAGMGSVAIATLTIIALKINDIGALVILIPMLAALLAFLPYSWYPSKVFIGDIGTLSIGAVMASAVIIGNYEMMGVIMIIPYALDFFIKLINRFPSKDWWGEYRDGKLHCPKERPIGLCQTIMCLTGGISERRLVVILILLEVLFGLVAILSVS